jgi:membrane-anchored glycerophosphoryl diester phosphodiesterase (GDPDase)
MVRSHVWCNIIFYVLLVCFYVMLRVAGRLRVTEDQFGEVPGNSSYRQVVPLITFLYLIMFLLINVTCSG